MSDLNISVGDVVRTSYGTGPYRVEHVARLRARDVPNHWDRGLVHHEPERLSLMLSLTGDRAPVRNRRGEVSPEDRYFISGVYAGGPEDYPISHDWSDCSRLEAGVRSGRYARASHVHLYVLERGTPAVIGSGQAVLL